MLSLAFGTLFLLVAVPVRPAVYTTARRPTNQGKGYTMTSTLDRRSMLYAAAGACVTLAATPLAIAQSSSRKRPDPLDSELVLEFIRVAHANLSQTEALLDREPRLIKAAWDWGGGDFETAIGAAGHMGRADIAGVLLDRGTPLELPAAAMLGQLAIVRAMLETRPSLLRVPGPHGIPLIAHARSGGSAAVPVLEYLEEFERSHPQADGTADAGASTFGGIYAGVYRGTIAGKDVGFEVTEHDRSITFQPLDGREPQEFRLSGEHRFEHSTFGAVLTFVVDGGHAVSLRAVQGEIEIQLMRVK